MEATRKPAQPPENRIIRPEPSAHRTFYREGGIAVTDRWLTIPGQRFAIAELHNLRTVRKAAGAPLMVMSTVMACVAVAAVAFGGLSQDPALMMGAPVLATVPLGFAMMSWKLRRRYFALYADYRGVPVQVLGARDERRYNQICRALLRAREYSRDHTY